MTSKSYKLFLSAYAFVYYHLKTHIHYSSTLKRNMPLLDYVYYILHAIQKITKLWKNNNIDFIILFNFTEIKLDIQ